MRTRARIRRRAKYIVRRRAGRWAFARRARTGGRAGRPPRPREPSRWRRGAETAAAAAAVFGAPVPKRQAAAVIYVAHRVRRKIVFGAKLCSRDARNAPRIFVEKTQFHRLSIHQFCTARPGSFYIRHTTYTVYRCERGL